MIIEKLKDPLYEIEIIDSTLKRAAVDIGDTVAFSADSLYSQAGIQLLNHFWKIISVMPDYGKNNITFRALQTQYFMTFAYLASGGHMVAYGSVALADIRINTESGITIADFGVADVLTENTGSLVAIYDSSGEIISGFISALLKENFFTYGEVDPSSKAGITIDTITLTDGDRDEDYWVSKFKASGYFANFTHRIDINKTAQVNEDVSAFAVWAVTNSDKELNEIEDLAQDSIFLWLARNTDATHCALSIQENDGGVLTNRDESVDLDINKEYYLTISRAGTVFKVEIYSTNALREIGAAGDIDTITWPTIIATTFMFIYALGSHNYGGTAKDTSGTTSNLYLASVDGVSIVSTPGGFTYDWNSLDSAFDYADATGYDYAIIPNPLFADGSITAGSNRDMTVY